MLLEKNDIDFLGRLRTLESHQTKPFHEVMLPRTLHCRMSTYTLEESANTNLKILL